VLSIFSRRTGHLAACFAGLLGFLALGCQHTPIDLTQGRAPWRIPRSGQPAETYEESLTGGEVFSMYCNQCHNARALAERPFSNYQNVAAHMRVRANITGVEYEKLLEFLRRWHDVPSPTPPIETSPKRMIFSQPIVELHDTIAPPAQPAAPAQPAPGPPNPQPRPGPAAGNLQPIPAPAGAPAISAPAGPVPPGPPA
jgi:hypothetical protein